MENQFIFLNIMVVLALILFMIILLSKFILYEKDLKIRELETKKDIKNLEVRKAEAESKTVSDNLKMAELQIQYSDFMKDQKMGTGEGYGKVVEDVMKEIKNKK